MQPGYVIAPQSSTTSTASSTKIGSIITSSPPYHQVSLTEVDVSRVKIGQLVTVTFDSLTGKTFTGKVSSIDTQGTVSSNVTTYSTYITLDISPETIFSNMAITANIIVATKDGALTVPTSAIVTQAGSTAVRVLQNNSITFIPVTTGLVAGGKTEIISGLSVDQEVVTAIVTPVTTSTTGQSVFSGQIGGAGRQLRTN